MDINLKQKELEKSIRNDFLRNYEHYQSYTFRHGSYKYIPELKELLELWLKFQSDQKSKHKFYKFIKAVDHDMLVFVTIVSLSQNLDQRVIQCAAQIGSLINKEILFKGFKNHNPELYHTIIQKLADRYSSSIEYRMAVLRHYYDYTDILSKKAQIKLGTLLVHFAMHSGLIEIDQKFIQGKRVNFIRGVGATLEDSIFHNFILTSKHKPHFIAIDDIPMNLQVPMIKRGKPRNIHKTLLQPFNSQRYRVNTRVQAFAQKVQR